MAHKSSSKPWKGSRHCAVIGCTNGDYNLGKWINSICSVYENCMHGTGICDCTQPFELFKFPAKLKNPDGRRKWIQILNRDKPGGNKWSPSHGSRVCSRHFIEGAPTRTTTHFPLKIWAMIQKGKSTISLTKLYFVLHLLLLKLKGKSPLNVVLLLFVSNDEAFDMSSAAGDVDDMICATADHSYSRPNLEVSTVNVDRYLPFYVLLRIPYYLFEYVLNVYVMVVYSLLYRMKSMEPVHNTIVILRTLLLSAQEENLRLKSEIDSAKIQTIMYLS